MANQTTNLGLTLPIGGENVSRQVINSNNEIIDGAVGALPSGKTLQGQINALENEAGTVPSGKTLQGEIDDINNDIGNTALPTTAQTITGAIAEHDAEIADKADKVSSAVNGNLAGLDANGNLTDSGSKASDFATATSVGTVPTGKTVQGQIDDLVTEDVRLDGIKASQDNVYTYKEASGDVVEIDDAVAEAVKQIQIEIAPVQDLHGYDHPWVGGAVPNMIPDGTDTSNGYKDNYYLASSGSTYSNENFYVSEYFPVQAETDYMLSSSGSVMNSQAICFYDSSKTYISGQNFGNQASRKVTTPEGAAYAKCTQSKSDTFGIIQFELGETATTILPYSNICPITGWTGAEITRTGKNLLNHATSVENYSINASGVITELEGFAYSQLIPVKKGVEYTFSFTQTATASTNYRIHGYDKDGTWVEQISYLATTSQQTGKYNFSITVPNTVDYIRISYAPERANSFMLEEGSIVSAYEPFGTQYSITFPSSAGTVYGGTLTINQDGSGVLSVDHACLTFNSSTGFTMNTSGAHTRFAYASPTPTMADQITGGLDGKTNLFSVKTDYSSASNVENNVVYLAPKAYSSSTKAIIVSTDLFDSLESFGTYLSSSPLQVFYPIANADSYQLTATQVRTLLGYNFLYASTGSILSLLYPTNRSYTKAEEDKALDARTIHETNSTEAAVMTFADGADDLPMAVKVDIEPVQDLHGYDNPWVGGAGKNLLPLTIDGLKDANTTGTWNGNNYTIRGITYYINTDSSGNILSISASGTNTSSSSVANFDIPVDLPVGDYIFNGLPDDSVLGEDYMGINVTGSSLYLRANTTGRQREFSSTAEHHSGIAWLAINSGITVSNRTFYPMIRLATEADATFEPYSNICPITGRTGAEITRTGKNLLQSKISNANIVSSGLINDNTSYDMYVAKVKAGVTYVCSGNSDMANGYVIGFFTSEPAKNSISYNSSRSVESSTKVFTAPIDGYVAVRSANTDTAVQLEYGEISSTYEAYKGSTYSITFPTPPGTVYGGTLTVNKDGTGELVVDRAVEDLSNLTAGTLGGVAVWSKTLTNVVVPSSNSAIFDGLSSSFIKIRYNGVSSNVGTVAISTEAKLVVNNGSDSVAPTGQVLYYLATPITYQLTAPQIKTLLGMNNVWADTGNVLEVKYSADTKMYIDNLFASIIPATGVSF